MPVFLEPNSTFEVCLDADEHLPEEVRPTFIARSQSMRNQLKILDVVDRIFSNGNVKLEDLFRETIETLGIAVTGWRNMGGIEYSVDAFYDLLTYKEARELLRKVAYNQRVTPEQKKSSE
jgi:hypothetical protein